MSKILNFKFLFIILFTANQTFAARFYYQNSDTKNFREIYTGDLSFSYSLLTNKNETKEVIEKGLMRLTVYRKPNISTLWVEHRTRRGFLYLKFKNHGKNWESEQVSFHPYESLFITLMDDDCSSPPTEKNKIDLKNIAAVTYPQKFASLFFEKNCSEKLSESEFNRLASATFSILDMNSTLPTDPPALECVKSQSFNSPTYQPFKTLQNDVSQLLLESEDLKAIEKNSKVPFPISCNFDGESKKCGVTKQGQKTKISIDPNCLKQNSQDLEKTAKKIFMHEFAHTIRDPQSVPEDTVKEIDKGICKPSNVFFNGKEETKIAKDKLDKELNSQQSGAKTIAGDVINPYAAFADPNSPTGDQGSAIASNETVTTNKAQETNSIQRSIASLASSNGVVAASSINTSIPTIQQQAQYQNVKGYVDASVGAVAKKIAPIVSYVESPAFAATLPPTSFENGNSGSTSADSSTATAAVAARAAGPNRPANSGATSNGGNEVAAGNSAIGALSTGGGGGSSTSARSPAAVNKNTGRKPDSDVALDNVYAPSIRRRLLREADFAETLRQKGVQIEFKDGYVFKNSNPTRQYIEKNGVLVRSK